jgi:hypothetical protein
MRFDWQPPTCCRLFLVVLFIAAGNGIASAQPPDSGLPVPQLATILPSGGRAGTTFEVAFGGADLEEPQSLLFSHRGIKAEPIIPPAPKPDPKKPAPPPPVTKFKVTIAPETPPGLYDVRLVNKWGVSNPRAFTVGDLPEVEEKEPNDDVPQAQRVAINTTVNGTIGNPVDVDYYVFAGKKGQRALVSCLASSIDSRLQAGLDFFDAKGNLLAHSHHYRDNDALLDCTLPSDADYYVRVYEFTHTQGSPEHFYRLSITTAPWIDAVMPPMVEPGKTTLVTVYGRNLPGGQIDPTALENGVALERVQLPVTAPADGESLTFGGRVPPNAAALAGFEYRLRNEHGVSNPFFLTYAVAPVVFDNEANDTPETAQTIILPCEVAGRIEKRRDRDWYAFAAKKDEVYSIEVLSDRLGVETDMYFILRRADNKQVLVENDDNPEILSPVKFFTRTEDPQVYRFVVPADGKYELMVTSRDSDTRAGPRLYYRVRITPERPDFQVFILPAAEFRPDACCLLQGGSELMTAYVWRRDGFNDAVTLAVEGLPAGVTCPPQIVGPNLRQTSLTFAASPGAFPWTGAIHVKATATINGKPVVREARPASITWAIPQGSGIPTISRLNHSLMLAVRGPAPLELTATPEKNAVLQGGKVNVALKLSRLWSDFKTPLTVGPTDVQNELPPGLVFNNNNQPITMNPGKDQESVTFVANPNVPLGTYNIVLRGNTQFPYNKDPKAKDKPNVNILQPSAAFALTVLPAQVATLSVNNGGLTLKPGAQQEIVVRVVRQHNYQGEFKIELVLPANMKGIATSEAVIPPGKDETKFIVKVLPDAAPGNRTDIVVRAVAHLNGDIPVNHETKINVNVVK